MMYVMYGEIDLYAPETHSLKDKRMIIRSIKDTLKSRFDVIAREKEHQDIWRHSVIAVVAMSDSRDFLYTLWDKIVGFVEAGYDITISGDAVSVIQGEL